MIQAYISIRFKQFSRALTGLGLIRILFLSGVAGFAAFALFMQTAGTPNSLYSVGVYMAIIMLIHARRSDKQFLRIHFLNYKLIFLTEYFLLISPLFICLIYHLQWIHVSSILALTLLIINIDLKPRQKSLNTAIQRLIPSDCFEWKSGIRKTFFLIAALWLTGTVTSFFIGSVPLVMFALGIIPMGFYERREPVQMVLAYEMGPGRFLFRKIKMHLVLFTVLSVPLIIAFLLFHPDKWYIPVIEFFVFITMHIYVILTKYAFYQPNTRSNAQVFEALGAIGIIVPFFIPIVWLLSIHFYFRSRKNLNLYLNDYH